MATFKEIGINDSLIKAIEELGFENPMPVQEKVIPYLINEDRNEVIALAQTGTGKTAAFGLPLIQKTDVSTKRTQHLILSPTRELCMQIANDMNNYAKYTKGINIVPVFGGAGIEGQIKALKKGAHIICATPGRLIDLMNRGRVDISQIKNVVLDEADEMLNMGFREDLEEILIDTPEDKNMLLFSATMPDGVSRIANRFMKNPIELAVGRKNSGAENVEHLCFYVYEKERYDALKRIVDYIPDIYGIIFCRTRKETQEVADKLMKDGYNAEPLHGDMTQPARETVMNKFRIKHVQLLVATDVAARGLDVNDLTHVINFNLPEDVEIYTHRSGRTGRAGKSGASIIIANPKEKRKISLIEKQINKKFVTKDIPKGKDICGKQLFYLIDRVKATEVDEKKIESFLPEVYEKLGELEREELIKKFVAVEFNRFLDYYKNAKDIATPVSSKKVNKAKSDDQTRFFINLGKKDNLKPVTLIGMINDYTGIRDIEIGEIELLESFSFFEADSKYVYEILDGFKGQKFKKRKINLEISESKRKKKTRNGDDNGNRRNYSDKRSSKKEGNNGRNRDSAKRKRRK